jgi:hypothetical protein
MTIAPERLRLALDQMDQDDGFEFERFANEFLASELPALRPVAGVHDGGRDAFVHSTEHAPNVFCQHSVTRDWKRKIADTVATLRKNGFEPRELIYCTNREVQRDADELRAALRREGLSLDIRDRSWFEAVANGTPARIAAAERIATRYVDPLLSSRKIIADLSPALSDEEERVTATYLQLELVSKDPSKGLSKSCVEALVSVALREATPDQLVSRAAVRSAVARQLPGSEIDRAHLLADNALTRLVRRDVVKHHRKEDGFTLAFPYRTEMSDRLQGLLSARSELRSESALRTQEIAARLGLDFEFSPESLAADALSLLDYQLCERGRLAAVALAGRGDFFAPRDSLAQLAREMVSSRPELLQSVGQIGADRFADVVPLIAAELASYPTPKLLERLRITSDAYCLQFALQQTGDVQDALRKIISGTSLLVDTSVLIPAMAERLLPQPQRRLCNLLRGAAAIGCRLIVGDDVLNEVDTHLDRIRYAYRIRTEGLVARIGATGAANFEAALIRAYLEARDAKRFGGSFDDYIELFKGRGNPLQDLVEYLREDLSIHYDEMPADRAKVDDARLAELYDDWKQHKRRRPWVDEAAFETLVLHDVRSFLLIERLRKQGMAAQHYGHRWWWLVLDGSAFRFDRLRRSAGQGSICMSPEFFSRYVSLTPKPVGIAATARDLLPVCLEVSELGFVPPDLREEAIRTYEAAKDVPEYLRRRRLRDLVNKAFAERERLEDESQTE